MSSADIEVTHSSLLYQEKVWRDQAQAMGEIAAAAGNDQYSGNAGYFVDAVNAYDTACQDIRIWCGQGRDEMNSIADALKSSYATYKNTEHNITGQISQIGH